MATDIQTNPQIAFHRFGLDQVMKSITLFRDRIQKRKAYNRTVAELQNMPLDVALDLNIDTSDAHRIASRAIYG